MDLWYAPHSIGSCLYSAETLKRVRPALKMLGRKIALTRWRQTLQFANMLQYVSFDVASAQHLCAYNHCQAWDERVHGTVSYCVTATPQLTDAILPLSSNISICVLELIPVWRGLGRCSLDLFSRVTGITFILLYLNQKRLWLSWTTQKLHWPTLAYW